MDFIIGAPSGNGAPGKAYAVFGKYSFSSPLKLFDLNGTNGFVIRDIAGPDGTGSSVSSAGDINRGR
ncbi:MAG: Phytase-like domain-containing protein [Candidatus Midichloria mitochondrii]|uniref:Uncharacterized protein n=1 Tax=Midichloria mitochondrii (strain IricVA) TaxID=696127 RepID=F7XVJ1_MIDMI|nr:hypothetical protein [Candidatus Midichloria mitochondrii]AEI88690.1 hypothetical protein midi_00380 [Candidatus Midichloria mitochondrii IricVA]MDJ1256644.1 hypothetical protein [Candidatus Midichloria mitochondrii]MDJ1288370.1 hypothetical protein [Candidatus Midichloria mitochondrii]MDJ1299200.1 hypothetical protein [Candidatus Midichloria mitochondrii]MDJ1313333.1 hypothetical protein [Candidatus Midichloria mitochondrii]